MGSSAESAEPPYLPESDGVMQLRVVSVEIQGDGTVAVLTLAMADGTPMPEWSPGAHVDVIVSPGLERQYSLCGSVGVGQPWRLGVLREPASRGGSEYLHTRVRQGDKIAVRGPHNNFSLVDSLDYLFIAGGIGITPFLPMIAELEARGSSWSLTYGARSRSAMAFLDELARYGDKVTLWPQDERGLIDVAGLVGEPGPGTVVYCCGPESLLAAAAAAAVNLPPGTLHVEHFGPRWDLLNQERRSFEVRLDYSELTISVGADQTIVEALEAAGLEVVTSCREGTCGTCETAVLEGIPDHRDAYLSPAEKAANESMMICCSRARTDRLVLDL